MQYQIQENRIIIFMVIMQKHQSHIQWIKVKIVILLNPTANPYQEYKKIYKLRRKNYKN